MTSGFYCGGGGGGAQQNLKNPYSAVLYFEGIGERRISHPNQIGGSIHLEQVVAAISSARDL